MLLKILWDKNKMQNEHFLILPQCSFLLKTNSVNSAKFRLPSANSLNLDPYLIESFLLTLSQTTNFRLFQTEMLMDDNFNFDENGRNFFKWVENTVGKGEIARNEQFLLFPQCLLETYTADT